MGDNKFSGELGHLAPADTAAYDQAVDLYRTLLAVLDALLDRETDADTVARLNAASEQYADERRRLNVTDRAAINRVIDEYPAVIQQLRASLSE